MPANMTSAERFGFSSGPHGGPTAGAHSSEAGLRWTMPEGWQEVAPSSMRQASFLVAGRQDTECYLTILPGAAGGVEANIARWCGQMGLDPLGSEALAELPRRELLESDAVLVDLEGTYGGMGGEPRPDSRMVGLIAEDGASTLFLKMVGPSEVVSSEIERFEELAASFEHGTSHEHGATGATSAQGLAWDAPAGWIRASGSAMRLVTYAPEGTRDTECYVTILPGNAGGVVDNVNRWRGQLGVEPLTREAVAGLPTLSVLGGDAVLVEAEGDFSGMSGGVLPDAAFLGLVCSLGSRTLFVKMTGPRASMAGQRESFVGFCTSLRFEEKL